jgi:hypothetical protein
MVCKQTQYRLCYCNDHGDAYLLRQFIDSPLASEKNGSSEDTLDKLAPYALVQASDALFFQYGEKAIPRGLVLKSSFAASL